MKCHTITHALIIIVTCLSLWVAQMIISSCIATWTTSNPPTTDTSSDTFITLAEKIAFLEKYIVFRHSYQQLNYRIIYHNNSSGWVPGPSTWSITIIAQVPVDELPEWTMNLKSVSISDVGWLENLPGTIDRTGVTEWFQSGGTVVGIDRGKSVVVYRNTNI